MPFPVILSFMSYSVIAFWALHRYVLFVLFLRPTGGGVCGPDIRFAVWRLCDYSWLTISYQWTFDFCSLAGFCFPQFVVINTGAAVNVLVHVSGLSAQVDCLGTGDATFVCTVDDTGHQPLSQFSCPAAPGRPVAPRLPHHWIFGGEKWLCTGVRPQLLGYWGSLLAFPPCTDLGFLLFCEMFSFLSSVFLTAPWKFFPCAWS